MSDKKIVKLALSAMFCALVFVGTMISVPTPLVGNVNLGDCIIILCALILGGPWAVASSALGAALCDFISGYSIYVPATFVIKALMVVIILLLQKWLDKSNLNRNIKVILCVIPAELFMVIGYLFYEAIVLGYGFGALANVPFNSVQGILNIVIAIILYKLILKTGLFIKFKQKG